MRETVEFRIPEEFAQDYLPRTLGVTLGGFVRKVVLPISDPLVARIVEIHKEFKTRDELFFAGSYIHRQYTKREIELAKAFRAIVKHVFEPTGEDCGTVYDESTGCKYCGANARRVGDLILDSRRLPSRGNLAI